MPATKPGTKPGTSDEIDWNPANNKLRVTGTAQAAHRNRAGTSSQGVSAAPTRADGGGPLGGVGAADNNKLTGSVPVKLSLHGITAARNARVFNQNAFGAGVPTKVADL